METKRPLVVERESEIKISVARNNERRLRKFNSQHIKNNWSKL